MEPDLVVTLCGLFSFPNDEDAPPAQMDRAELSLVWEYFDGAKHVEMQALRRKEANALKTAQLADAVATAARRRLQEIRVKLIDATHEMERFQTSIEGHLQKSAPECLRDYIRDATVALHAFYGYSGGKSYVGTLVPICIPHKNNASTAEKRAWCDAVKAALATANDLLFEPSLEIIGRTVAAFRISITDLAKES